MKMKAAVLREFGKPATIEEVELAPPKEKEVLVRTVFTGFCQSDLHFMRGRVNFGLPGVLGHEAAGIVEEVGPGVTSVKKGDHVVATWMVPCGTCPECLEGSGLYLQEECRDIQGRPASRRDIEAEGFEGAPVRSSDLRFRFRGIHGGPRKGGGEGQGRTAAGPGLLFGLLPSDRLRGRLQRCQREAGRQRGHMGNGRRRSERRARGEAEKRLPHHRHRSRGKQGGDRQGVRRHPFYRQQQGGPGSHRKGAHRRRRQLYIRSNWRPGGRSAGVMVDRSRGQTHSNRHLSDGAHWWACLSRSLPATATTSWARPMA